MLRTWLSRDVDQIVAACQDEALQRFIPVPRPYDHAVAAAYIERTHAQWADGSKAAFAVVDAHASSLVLGSVNLAHTPPSGNAAYWVAPHARGRGVAPRALHLLAHWALHRLGLGVVVLEIHPENAASIAVAQRAGFHRSGVLDRNDATGAVGDLIFSRYATDVEPAPEPPERRTDPDAR